MHRRVAFRHLIWLISIPFLYFSPAANSETAAEMAKRMYKSFDLSELMFPLRRALKEEPKNAELHYLMGKMYMTQCGSKLRGARELELALKYAPDASFAPECKLMIARWNTEQATKGEKFAWSNLDCWFNDYYKKNAYHSTDPDPEPDWAKKSDASKEWKVDVHLIACSFHHPFFDDKPIKAADTNWRSPFMDDFYKAWETKAKEAHIEGSADLYCAIDNDGVVHPIIFHQTAGILFRKLLLSTFSSLDSRPSLMLAGKSNAIFKARIACRNAYSMSGTWHAFTHQGGPITPVRVSFGAEAELDKSKSDKSKLSLSNSRVEYQVVEPMKPARRTPRRKPQTAIEKAKEQSTIDQAKTAIFHRIFENAYDLLWPLVERDNAEACYLMATALAAPENSHPQPRVAELFMQKAVDLGDSTAVNQFLDSVEFGNARMSMEQAIALCKKNADNGLSSCQTRLGRYLEFGDGVEQDKELAIKYYNLAATAGDAEAKEGLLRLSKK